MRHFIANRPLYRLFFALKPGSVAARQTDHFSHAMGTAAYRVQPDHLHMTLGVTADHLDYPYDLIKALLRAGTCVMAEPFDLLLDRLRISNRSAALCPSRSVPPLRRLQRQIIEAMGRAGVPLRPGWSFNPHQTLFYRPARPEQRRVEGFHWRVEEFVLICSHVGRTRHDLLGTWPLAGGRQYELF
ncbi:2'-5' RNA ligase family protein [Sphingobium sp. DC-2]|uniref:2'-5' RNA ligase family protein n=1 Tax=Sphingobium sp. DC-2 TaxID=1303256 RepID=UPI0004C327BE|nr:2'-5' RNA ligase family protein [Sphingobium sp. DC-2]